MRKPNNIQWAPPRGMRDFYPEQMRIQNWLFSCWRESAIRFGFEEYSGSVVEQEELFVLKSGEEIVGQLFNFTDKGGRRVALRPEMTPTLARMIAAKGHTLPKPLKWFSVVQCFRYERMSRGRRREHHQWNLDIVGVPGVEAEAELLAVAVDAIETMGLSHRDVVIRISHRGFLGTLLEALGLPREKSSEILAIIDKRGKEPDATLQMRMESLGLQKQDVQDLFSRLDEKDLEGFSRVFRERALPTDSLEQLEGLFAYLEDYGIHEYCEFCPSIVRGLPYYTGIVFECFDRKGRFRAVFGGGRYDQLFELFGAEPLPSAGLGFGDVVIQEILAETGRLPDLSERIDFFFIPYSRVERGRAIRDVQRLRKQGFRADLLLVDRKLKGALREAARKMPHRAVLLLPEELERGLIVLRDLESGREERVPEATFLEDPARFLPGERARRGSVAPGLPARRIGG